MQGQHPVLQRGEETEAVLHGYVQTEMLWLMFTERRLHLVMVSGHTSHHMLLNRWTTMRWTTEQRLKDIVCEWMLQELHMC